MNKPLMTSLLICAAALALPATAQTARPSFIDLDDATIEDAFWQCDVLSMQVALAPGDGVVCERLADALKQRRFGGDYSRLLAWWQDRKTAEHAKRGIATATAFEAP